MKRNHKGFIYVFLFSLFYAIDVMLVKFGILQGAEPYVINYQAYFITVILMFIYIQSKTKSKLRHNPKDIPKIVLLGILGSGIGSFIGYTGLKFSDVTNYAFIIRSIVAFAVIFGYFLGRDIRRVSLLFWFVLILLLIAAEVWIVMHLFGRYSVVGTQVDYLFGNGVPLFGAESPLSTVMNASVGGMVVYFFFVVYLYRKRQKRLFKD